MGKRGHPRGTARMPKARTFTTSWCSINSERTTRRTRREISLCRGPRLHPSASRRKGANIRRVSSYCSVSQVASEDPVSQQREHARVPRDHLPQPVHPSAGRIEKGVDGSPAVEATHAPLTPFQRTWTFPRADRRCHLDPRTTGGS